MVKKILDPMHFSPWKLLFINNTYLEMGSYIFRLNKKSLETIIHHQKNHFWQDCIRSWAKVSEAFGEDVNQSNIFMQPLWLNKDITSRLGVLFYMRLV